MNWRNRYMEKPIEGEFKDGYYYKYTRGKSEHSWNNNGKMDFVLDGKWRKWNSGMQKFEGEEDRGGWQWFCQSDSKDFWLEKRT